METTLTATTFIESELQKFETDHQITETGLLELVKPFKSLKVNGVDDKEGLKAVEAARKTLKAKRVEIEKVAKNMRESATKFNKAVLAREKELVAIIEPTEDTLLAIESEIEREKEQLRIQKEKEEALKLQARLDKLNAVNYAIDLHDLQKMTDEYFNIILKEATAAHEEKECLAAIEREKELERARIEELNRKEEENRLRLEREEQERARKKLEEEQAAFRAEQERKDAEFKAEQARIQKENDDKRQELEAREAELKRLEEERVREIQLEQAKKEAAEKAKIEAEEKAKRKEQEKKEKEEREKEEEMQKLLFGEDSDRFAFLAQQIDVHFLKSSVWTAMKSKKGKIVAFNVRTQLQEAFNVCEANKK